MAATIRVTMDETIQINTTVYLERLSEDLGTAGP